MNRVRIARELVRIAKSLVGGFRKKTFDRLETKEIRIDKETSFGEEQNWRIVITKYQAIASGNISYDVEIYLNDFDRPYASADAKTYEEAVKIGNEIIDKEISDYERRFQEWRDEQYQL